jgi:hypothetical protein
MMAESDRPIVATLKVLRQRISDEQYYPIREGETTVGRGKDNEVIIRKKGLSKNHAVFLVEDGEHFIKDCGSKNKTYRRRAQLRPDAFYELVDKCHLTFGDLKCQYLFSDSLSSSECVDAVVIDSTVPYASDFSDDDSGGPTPELQDSVVQPLVPDDKRSHGGHVSFAPSGDLSESSESCSKTVPVETANTVAYSDTVPYKEDTDGTDKRPDSPPSSPDLLDSPSFLCPPPQADTNESNYEEETVGEKERSSIRYQQTLLLEEDTPDSKRMGNSTVSDTFQDASTLQYSPPSELPVSEPRASVPSETVATLPYSETSTVEATIPYASESADRTDPPTGVDQTVPYQMAEDDDETDIEDGCNDEHADVPQGNIDQTVPYELGEEEPEQMDDQQQTETVRSSKPLDVGHISPTPETAEKCSEEVPEQLGGRTRRVEESSVGKPTPEQTVKEPSVSEKQTVSPAVIAPESPPIQDPFDLPSSSENPASSKEDPMPVASKPKRSGKAKVATSSKGSKVSSEASPIVKVKKQSTAKTPTSRKGKSAKVSTPSLPQPDEDEEPMDMEPKPDPTPSRGKGKGRMSKSKSSTLVSKVHTSTESPLPSSETSSLNESSVKVLFTGVEDKDSEKVIASIGGKMADSVYECSHLVTDKMRRTMKFLCCLARGCHIVSFKWIEKCNQQKKFVDSQPFTLKDKLFEKQHNFNLAKSIAKARSGPAVLSGYQCFLSKGVKPNQEHLIDIIKCAGGSVLSSLPDSPGEHVVIISSEEDVSSFADAQDRGFPIYSTEFVFSGILKQEVATEENKLSCPDTSSRSEAGGSSRSRKRQADSTTSRNKRTKK